MYDYYTITIFTVTFQNIPGIYKTCKVKKLDSNLAQLPKKWIAWYDDPISILNCKNQIRKNKTWILYD